MKEIYLDNNATTKVDEAVFEEMRPYFCELYGNPSSMHFFGGQVQSKVTEARERVAELLGASPDEIIFTASGTEGNNLAIAGVLRPLLQQHGELHAITLSIEHQSVLEPLRALEADGLYTTSMPVSGEGLVSLEELKETINDETVFISIQLVNSEVGTIEPVREIAKLIRTIRKERKLPLYFHCDASQAPLWIAMKVDALGCDLITLDGQKVLGPKGVGALYVKRRTDIEPVTRPAASVIGTAEISAHSAVPSLRRRRRSYVSVLPLRRRFTLAR